MWRFDICKVPNRETSSISLTAMPQARVRREVLPVHGGVVEVYPCVAVEDKTQPGLNQGQRLSYGATGAEQFVLDGILNLHAKKLRADGVHDRFAHVAYRENDAREPLLGKAAEDVMQEGLPGNRCHDLGQRGDHRP